jgi:hypothetical protein
MQDAAHEKAIHQPRHGDDEAKGQHHSPFRAAEITNDDYAVLRFPDLPPVIAPVIVVPEGRTSLRPGQLDGSGSFMFRRTRVSRDTHVFEQSKANDPADKQGDVEWEGVK